MNVIKKNVAIVGCGQIFKQHYAACAELSDEITLLSVCDIKEDRARDAGQMANVPWTTDYSSIVQNSNIDVISICTPHHLHVPMALQAIRAGKDVIVEKPLGLNTHEVDSLLAEAEELGRKIFVILQVRYNPPLVALQSLIKNGGLGAIHSVAMVVRWYRPQEYYDRSDWHGKKDKEGGFLLSQGIHYIDTLRWLAGPVKKVDAHIATVGHSIETEDLVHGLLEFTSGAVATIEMSLCTFPRNLECSLSFSGSKGMIKISGTALDKIETWEVPGTPIPNVEEGLKPNVYAGGLYQGSCPNHTLVYRDMLAHYAHGTSYINGNDARDAIALVDALYHSALDNK